MNKHVLLMGAKGMEEQLSAPQGLARDWTAVQLGSLRTGALGLTRGSRSWKQVLAPWPWYTAGQGCSQSG